MTRDRAAPLDRPTYQVNEAARLLGLPDKTLRRWLDGDRRFDRTIPPIIRAESTGATDVTWGEFVEAGLLAAYRQRRLPLERLRPLIAELRHELQTPYPLALARPLYADGGRLLWRLQQQSGIDADLFLVVEGLNQGYQLALAPIAEEFVSRVDFEPPLTGAVVRWYPLAPKSRRVVLDPRISFGLPTINGIRTEVLAELAAAGERTISVTEAFVDYGITAHDVDEAVEYERMLAAAA